MGSQSMQSPFRLLLWFALKIPCKLCVKLIENIQIHLFSCTCIWLLYANFSAQWSVGGGGGQNKRGDGIEVSL
jgi:hypothetical protein